MAQERRSRHPHPWLFLWMAGAWGITVFILPDLLSQTLLFLLVLAGIAIIAGRIRSMWEYLRWSLPLMVIYTLASSLFGQSGGTVLWTGPHIPALGTPSLSTEGLHGGLVRTLRLWDLLGFLMVLFRAIQSDDIVYWLGRRFSRIGLTLSMVLTFIPALLDERRRIADVVRIRGALRANTSWRLRIRAQAAVYQALLMNALERAWQLAESMHLRGYGGQARTAYLRPAWHPQDVRQAGWLLATVLIAGGVWMYGWSPNGWAMRMALIAAAGISWIGLGVRVRA